MSDRDFPATGEGPDSLLRLVADSVPALIAYYEIGNLTCRFANRRYAEYNGWTPQSILGKTVREAIGEAAWQVIEAHVRAVSTGQTVKYVRQQTLPDGGKRMIDVSLIPHFSEAGPQIGAFVLINDITEQWRAEQAIRDSETRMRKFADATGEGIVFHKGGTITDANPALLRMLGYSMDEMLGRQTIEFVAEAWKQTVIDYIRAGREDPYEAELLHKDGGTIPVEIIGKSMPYSGGIHRLAVIRDITLRKLVQERIEFLALHDSLTQLPNRLYLNEYLPQTLALARRHQKSVAMLFIDLDDFKQVNDTLGHLAGDALLREVAKRLQVAVRESDLVARLGGDEFLVMLMDICGEDDVSRSAGALLDAMRKPFIVEGQPCRVCFSIGISLFPVHGESMDDLIRHADTAMYRAKNDGGNRYCLARAEAPRL